VRGEEKEEKSDRASFSEKVSLSSKGRKKKKAFSWEDSGKTALTPVWGVQGKGNRQEGSLHLGNGMFSLKQKERGEAIISLKREEPPMLYKWKGGRKKKRLPAILATQSLTKRKASDKMCKTSPARKRVFVYPNTIPSVPRLSWRLGKKES